MNKRIVFGALAVVALLLAACGTSGSTKGATEQEPPFTEANFKYERNQEGGITITGYVNNKTNGIRNFVIPAQIEGVNVTRIGGGAFTYWGLHRKSYGVNSGPNGGNEDAPSLANDVFENVTIPPTVTSIGPQAFCNRGIKTLILPEGLQIIGEEAFAGNELTSVALPSSLTTLYKGAFDDNPLTPAEAAKVKAMTRK